MRFEPTSERLFEDSYRESDASYIIYLFHIATYRFAEQFCHSRTVLDMGCGTGYGTNELSKVASNIVGVDVAEDAIAYARARYRTGTLQYELIDPTQPLPFADKSFDVVTSFQVIEHVEDPQLYLREALRVLRPDGILIVATPDRRHRLFPFQKPWNPWHLIEYSGTTLRETVGQVFDKVELLQMSGKRSLVDREVARSKKIRLMSIPFTLPFVPEFARRRILQSISRFKGKETPKHLSSEVASYDENDVYISANANPSVNLIAIAKRGNR